MQEYDNNADEIEVITVYRSFDFESYDIKEADKNYLYEIERTLAENQETVTKELCEIAKKLSEARKILGGYADGCFNKWFENLGFEKNYVNKMIDKYELVEETHSEKAIDLPVRLVSDMKKEDLDTEQKTEIVNSLEPKQKFKEIKEEIYGPEPEKNEVEIILDKIHKAELAITKQEEKIERLKDKLERIRDM
jgi:hypothetical protein